MAGRQHKKRPVHLKRLYEIQQGVCAICGGLMPKQSLWRFEGIDRPTLDHVQPLALGGMDTLCNIVAAHKSCNTERADALPTPRELSWLEIVKSSMRMPEPSIEAQMSAVERRVKREMRA